MNYFVTAIDTDSGKTLVSAILCEALEADYWKPVQAGLPRDSETVKNLLSNKKSMIHPEAYLLKTPASPHAAAETDGVRILLKNIVKPATKNTLIIEGAGGCLVPLNKTHLVIDLIASLKARVILVSDIYLGSINHTLLTVEALNHRKIPVEGIIFNGNDNPQTREIITHYSGLKTLLHIKKEAVINKGTVKKYAGHLKPFLK